jgi:hypothetical protein
VNKLDPDSESPATERLGRIYIHHVNRLQPDEQDGDDVGDQPGEQDDGDADVNVGYGTSNQMVIAIIEKI